MAASTVEWRLAKSWVKNQVKDECLLLCFFFFFSFFFFFLIFFFPRILFSVWNYCYSMPRDLVPFFSLSLSLCKNKKKRIQLMFCCIIEDSVSCESILLYFLLSVPFICLFSICLSSVIFKNLQHLEKKMMGIYYFLKVRHFLFSLRKKNQQ